MEKDINIGLVSLGCPKNEVDAENMLYAAKEAGYNIESDPNKCQIIIINTCGFIESAKQEAIDSIFEINDLRQNGILEKVIVTGCFSQRYSNEIYNEMPEVDCVLGVSQYPDIAQYINRCLDGERVIDVTMDDTYCSGGNRLLTTPGYRVYLKISEGCSNNCTYCAIPSIKGKLRSRSIESIITETGQLIKNGAKEITLVAQDTTRYGEDIGTSLAELLELLARMDKNVWFRVMYMYPEMIDKELIAVFKKHDNICSYMDVPLQHASDKILKTMNRTSDYASIVNMYNMVKSEIPDITLRTTFITGFPGETDEDFNELLSFVKEYPFDNVGVFSYSKEEGTPAYNMKNQIDEDIAKQRRDTLLEVQRDISHDLMQKHIGKTYDVLIEDEEDGCYYGRSQHFAYEIDGEIQIVPEDGTQLALGQMVKVKIIKATSYDLLGELV